MLTSAHKLISVKGWIRRFATRTTLGFTPPFSSSEQEEILVLQALLSSINLREEDDDSLIRRWNNAGLFSAKSAYDFWTFGGVNDCKVPHLWKRKVPLKIKVFMWLAMRKRILTANVLVKRGCHGPTICMLCLSDKETSEHLFFGCSYARSLWYWLLCAIPTTADIVTQKDRDISKKWTCSRELLSGPSKVLFDLCFVGACWEIWKERDKRIFNSRGSTYGDLGKTVVSEIKLWRTILCTK